METEEVMVTLPLTTEEKAEDADQLVQYRKQIGESKLKMDAEKEYIKAVKGKMETVMLELDSGNRDHKMDLFPRKNFTYQPPRIEWVDDKEKVWKSRELTELEQQTTLGDWVITEEGTEEKPKLKKA